MGIKNEKSQVTGEKVTGHKSQATGLKLKLVSCVLCLVSLTGCGAYKFNYGKKPYEGGYVVARRGYAIPEYTIGKDKIPPADLNLAKKRFKRRKDMVEHYYKKMGFIQNGLKEALWNYPTTGLGFMFGVFRLPFIASADRKYENNPEYKKKIDEIDRKQDIKEREKISSLKDKLNKFVEKDLLSELSSEGRMQQAIEVAEKQMAEVVPVVVEKIVEKKIDNHAIKVSGENESAQLKAVIIARPVRGYSPLFVRFYGNKSCSKNHNKIVSYSWDFGDTDTSALANPVNTYYSGSLEPAYFDVTLTVKDTDGNTAFTSAKIEVLNK